MATLVSLPLELLRHVASYLRPNELSSLLRTAKVFVALESQLWRSIDLHTPQFHRQQDSSSSDLRFHVDAHFHARKVEENERRMQYKTERLFALATMRATDPERWRQLTGMVRHLCLSIRSYRQRYGTADKTYDVDMFRTILSFENLETLHLFANIGQRQSRPDTIIDEPMEGSCSSRTTWSHYDQREVVRVGRTENNNFSRKLRDVRLRGHIPRHLVRKIFEVPRGIETLDLGLLAPAFEHQSATLLENEDPVPAAPCSLVWMSQGFVPKPACFQALTTLCLSKPSESRALVDYDCDCIFDEAADEMALEEWAQILSFVHNPIVSLTFDLLPVGPDIMLDGDLFGGAETGSNPGTERFCQFLLPSLLEDRKWPALTRLEFRGFNPSSADRPGSIGAMDLLRRKFGNVDIQCTAGRWILFMQYDDGYLQAAHVEDGLGLTEDGKLDMEDSSEDSAGEES